MPHEVTIRVNKNFKPKSGSEKEQFDLAQQIGDKKVTYQTAVEAVKNSGGMYEIAPDQPAPVIHSTAWHTDKTNQELVAMLAAHGIKTEKQMKRSDIIGLLEKKFAEVEVTDD